MLRWHTADQPVIEMCFNASFNMVLPNKHEITRMHDTQELRKTIKSTITFTRFNNSLSNLTYRCILMCPLIS